MSRKEFDADNASNKFFLAQRFVMMKAEDHYRQGRYIECLDLIDESVSNSKLFEEVISVCKQNEMIQQVRENIPASESERFERDVKRHLDNQESEGSN